MTATHHSHPNLASHLNPELAALSILQERDLRHLDLLQQLQRLPAEIASARQKVADDQAVITAARDALKALEVRRSSLDKERQSIETDIVRYKTQQISVKKQDELIALNHEIERAEARVDALEMEEIETLMAIDTAKATLATTQAERNPMIALFQREVETLLARTQAIETQVPPAAAAVAETRPNVPTPFLRAYDAARRQRPKGPILVPVEAGKCTGCHLKICGETDTALLQPTNPVICENCGRLLYR